MCYLVLLATALGIKVVIEQPSTSLLWKLKPVADLLSYIQCAVAAADMGAYGAPTKKALVFKGTLPGTRG